MIMETAMPDSIPQLMDGLGRQARDAARVLAMSSGDARNAALQAASAELRSRQAEILEANAKDMHAAGERGLSAAMLDRLMLDEGRIEGMAAGLDAIAALPEPLGRVMAEWQRPNGLKIQRVAVPLGVIGIIYESRPNVTADAAGLCVKSGNAVILRGGSESFYSSRAVHACLVAGLEKSGLPAACVQMVPTTDRAAVGYLLSSMSQWVDVVVPRGGKNLIRRVQERLVYR
jgi:glutamate-5-semialdehyde dehydrogenase